MSDEHDDNGPPIDIWSSFHKAVIKAVIKSESQYSPSETEEFVATSKAIEKLLSKLDEDDKNTLNRLLAKQTDIFKNYLSERELCNCGVYRWLVFHGEMIEGWQCPVHGVKT